MADEVVLRLRIEGQNVQVLDSASASLNKVQDSAEGVGVGISQLGEHFAEMVGVVALVTAGFEALKEAAKATFDFIKDGVVAADNFSVAEQRLASIATTAGASIQAVNAEVEHLASEGLVKATDAATALSNLMARGFSADQAATMIEHFANIATTIPGLMNDVSGSVVQFTDAILKGRIAGADLNAALPSLKEELKNLGLTMQDLVNPTKEAEVRLAILNATIRDDHGAADSFTVEWQKMQNTFEEVGRAIGELLLPALKQIATSLDGFLTTVREMTPGLKDLGSIFSFLASGPVKELKDAFDLANAALIVLHGNMLLLQSFSSKDLAIPEGGRNIVGTSIDERMKSFFKGIDADKDAALAATKKFDEEFQKHMESMAKAAEEAAKRIHEALRKLAEEQAKSDMKELAADFDVFQHAMDQVSSQASPFGQFGNQISLTKDILSSFDTELNNSNQIGDTWSVSVKGWGKVAIDFGQDLQQADDSVQQFNDAFAKNSEKAKEWADKNELAKESLKRLTEEARNAAQIFGELAQIIGGIFGGVLGSVASGLDAFSQKLEETGDKGKAVLAGIGAGMAALGQVIGGTGGRIISEIGAIAQAFAESPILGIITAITVAVSELWRAFQKNWGDAVAKSLANAFGIFGVSDDLIKRIADDAKKLNDQELAIVLHMKDLIDETGIGANNIQQYLSMARNVFDYLNRGLLTTAQATDILNSTFAQLAAAAEQFGGAYMTQLKELISLSHQFGLNVQAIADYTKAAFADATTALSAMVDAFSAQVDRFAAKMKGVTPGDAIGIPAHLASGFENLASMFLQQFNAMEAAGMSFNEIMQQLGPTFEKLETMAKQLGLTGSQAFQDLSGIWDALKDDKGALSHAQNLLQWITAMDKVTRITAQQFNNLQHVTSNTFDKLTADIQKHLHNHQKASDAALRQMLPSLMEIIKLHDEYGYKIDKNTQKLIDQAKAEGLIKPDPMQQMIDVLTHMDQTLTQLAQTFGVATTGVNNFAAALQNVPSQIDVNVNTNYTSYLDRIPGQRHLLIPPGVNVGSSDSTFGGSYSTGAAQVAAPQINIDLSGMKVTVISPDPQQSSKQIVNDLGPQIIKYLRNHRYPS